jgi:hypothetical protein
MKFKVGDIVKITKEFKDQFYPINNEEYKIDRIVGDTIYFSCDTWDDNLDWYELVDDIIIDEKLKYMQGESKWCMK